MDAARLCFFFTSQLSISLFFFLFSMSATQNSTFYPDYASKSCNILLPTVCRDSVFRLKLSYLRYNLCRNTKHFSFRGFVLARKASYLKKKKRYLCINTSIQKKLKSASRKRIFPPAYVFPLNVLLSPPLPFSVSLPHPWCTLCTPSP